MLGNNRIRSSSPVTLHIRFVHFPGATIGADSHGRALVPAGDVLGVFEESDRHVGVVEYAVDVAAVGVDLF
jgi:hypothetical protein